MSNRSTREHRPPLSLGMVGPGGMGLNSWDNRPQRLSFWNMVLVSATRALLPVFVDRKLLGAANIPRSSPFLVVTDSESLSAFLSIVCDFPAPLHFLGSKAALSAPLVAPLLREINVLETDLGPSSGFDFLPALRVVRSGGSVVAPLSGLPSVDGEVSPALVGIGMIAYETSVSVVPVRVFPPTAALGKTLMKVGPPVSFAGSVPGLSPREKYHFVGSSIFGMLSSIKN